MQVEPYLLFLAIMVYLLFAWLFLRNEQLAGVYKWLFSLTFLPMFLGLMFANIWIADHIFPNILEWHSNLRGRGNGAIAFLLTAVIPITVCWLWYVLFVRLSRHRSTLASRSRRRQ